jgi:DNA primase
MIDNLVIEKIIEASDCYEVIKDFVELKRNGSNWTGLSPFTDEKTPSFIVSPVKNIWKDYSSGNGGHAITFLIKARKMNFPEAIKYLGNKYGIEVKDKKKSYSNSNDALQASTKKSYYAALEFSSNHFHGNLKKNKKTLDYLTGRGFTTEIIDKFNLGYSLNSWDDLYKSSLKAGYYSKDLNDVDLLSNKSRKFFDKFRDRLMFPISDTQGKVIGFGARILNEDKDQPKYLNSSETVLYKKSFVLYGFDLSVQDIIRKDSCYIVEGYTDVISFHQSGVSNTVASCGTALTIEQLKIIKKYTQNVSFIFDGDKAGVKATYKSIDLALEIGLNVSVLKLENVDPDELSKSKKDLSGYIDHNLMDFVDYKVSFIKNSKIDLKAKHINGIIKSVTFIEDSIKRKLYLKKVKDLFSLDKKDVTDLIQAQKKSFKASFKKVNVFTQQHLNSLNEICINNPKLSIEGVSLLNYVILKIQELESGEIKGFIINPNNNKNLIVNDSKEKIFLDEIYEIFKLIKLDFINIKLTNLSPEDNLDYLQDLIFIKQNI